MRMFLALCLLIGLAFSSNADNKSVITKAERMTPQEIDCLAACESLVEKAQAELAAVQQAIATAHGIKAEAWMEWKSWYEFSGVFVLRYFWSF